MKNFYLGIGSNKGDRIYNLAKAIKYIQILDHSKYFNVSNIYETEPVGLLDQRLFLNAVVWISSSLSPFLMLNQLNLIENKLGRTRKIRWGPRTIDIDILSIDSLVINTKTLTVPHPELLNRNFVLLPFAEISPHYIIPGDQKSVHDVLKQCKDQSKICLFMDKTQFLRKLKEVD